MSDLTALAEKLDALRASDDVFEHGARVISQGGVPSGMNALIRAIDETVLERKLEIMTGTHLISLIAAGRRLRGISGVVPAKGKSARLVGEAMSRENTKNLDAAFGLLSDLVGPAPKLTLRSLPAEPFGRSGERGVTARELAEFWQVDLDEKPLPQMTRFLVGNEGAIAAHLHVVNGEIESTEGDVTVLHDVWETQVSTFLQTLDTLPGRADGPQLITLDGALEDGKTVALGLAGDDVALLIYDPGALGALHASWQAIYN